MANLQGGSRTSLVFVNHCVTLAPCWGGDVSRTNQMDMPLVRGYDVLLVVDVVAVWFGDHSLRSPQISPSVCDIHFRPGLLIGNIELVKAVDDSSPLNIPFRLLV
ncbi:hypothetical protein EJ08DRAFT_652833 [Tothia fuscella]|uniref:Uncharacterized protein n=1 Tax=Tothia fuscella TaxID=1048955 RepID=A0A9P4NIT5_9PEZI|nr:hypothetical protein EJ08DRAFT_652833 [Tothia fuscella]